MGTFTDNLGMYKPALSETGWGDEINGNFDTLDERLSPLTAQVMHVHPQGDNANDGLTWATPKKHILAAYDAISAGQIQIYTGSNVGGEVAQQGIWIVGGHDPAFSSPPAGFRQQKNVEFVGVPSANSIQFGKPGARILGGTTNFPYDTSSDLPCIWLSGINTPMTFRNLWGVHVNQGIRAGISTTGDRDMNTSQIIFDNVSFSAYNVGVPKSFPKPMVELGYVFWFWFDHCVFHGYPLADIDSDERAAMMMQGGTLNGGLTVIENTTLSGGGIRYHATGASSWSIDVRDVIMEGDFVNPSPSVVKIIGQERSGQGYIERVAAADVGTGSQPAVDVDERQSPLATLVVDCGPDVAGPCTIMGGYVPSWGVRTASVAGRNQLAVTSPIGVISPLPQMRRVASPVTVPYANICEQTNWTGMTGSATVTTGQRAPDGTLNAVKLTHASALADRQPWRGSRAVAAGDWFIMGSWVKGDGTFNQLSTGIMELGANPQSDMPFTTGALFGLGLPWFGDDEWQFLCGARQVESVVGSPVDLVFSCRTQNGKEVFYYMPMLVQIPASDGLSESEVMEILYSFQSYPTAAIAGETTTGKNNRLYTPNGIRMTEQSDQAAPSTNNVVIYAKDNGAGKTQLVARFPTGAVQQIAIEP